MPNSSLTSLLKDKNIVVVGGTGGVGKTTLSAALSVLQAAQGRKVALITIDPARRLGAALGLPKLGNRLQSVPERKLAPLRRKKNGALSVAMFDAKSTFDNIVKKYAPTPLLAERILNNVFYKELSTTLSGTHEYMALERIYEIYSTGEFDLLILDTPPASAMADFLEAPQRLKAFLDRDVVKWFTTAGSQGTLGRGMEWALSLFQKLAGGNILGEMVEFLSNFQTLFEGLRYRAETVEKLLADEKTAYILVTTSDSVPVYECLRTAETLKKGEKELCAILLNRTLPSELPTASRLQRRESSARAAIEKAFKKTPIISVPMTEKDPTSLKDLALLWKEENAISLEVS